MRQEVARTRRESSFRFSRARCRMTARDGPRGQHPFGCRADWVEWKQHAAKPSPDRRDDTSPRRWQPALHGASHPAIGWTPLRGHAPSITDENTLSLRPRPRFFRLDCPQSHDRYGSPHLNQSQSASHHGVISTSACRSASLRRCISASWLSVETKGAPSSKMSLSSAACRKLTAHRRRSITHRS